MAKNDNRNFNTLQRALSTDQNTLQSLAGRLTSDGVGGQNSAQQFVVDGLRITSTGALSIGISAGTASITNPSVGTLEPQKLIVSLRSAESITIPAPATWYTVSANLGTPTSTNAVIDIYNQTTQTFSGVNSLVQTTNNFAFTLTAGTSTTWAATPAGHMLLGYVKDTVVYNAQPTLNSTIAAPMPPPVTRVVYNRNSISIDSTGALSWESYLTTAYGNIYASSTAIASSLLCDGVSLTDDTLYHLYVLLPNSQAAVTIQNRIGIPVISTVAPSGGARTATITGFVDVPGGTGIYCGSMYHVTGSQWSPWEINGNQIDMTSVPAGYIDSVSTGAAASATLTPAAFAGTLPPNRQICLQMTGATGSATSGTLFTMAMLDASNSYNLGSQYVPSSGIGRVDQPFLWVDSARVVQAYFTVGTGTGTYQLSTILRGVRF